MKQTKTPKEWFDEYVNMRKLYDSIAGAINDAVREDSLDMDGGSYVGLVHDIISGGNGQYIPFLALEYFDFEVDTDNIEQYDLRYTLDTLESFTSELEYIIESEMLSHTGVTVQFGYWESDGTYCMMAHMSKDDYKRTRGEYESLMNDEG